MVGDASSWTFWSLGFVNAVVMIVLVYLLCAVRILREKVQTVATTSGIALTRVTKGFQLRTPAHSTTISSNDSGYMPFKLFEEESFFLSGYFVIVVPVGLVLIVIFLRWLESRCTGPSRTSLLYIVVRNGTCLVELLYYKFLDASRNYTLLLRGGRLGIKLLDYGLFGRLHVVGAMLTSKADSDRTSSVLTQITLDWLS